MTVRTTSLAAYESIQAELNTKQEKVFDALTQLGSMCNQEIADVLGWPINTVTPRVKELREKGLVVERRRAKYEPTGRTCIFWAAA